MHYTLFNPKYAFFRKEVNVKKIDWLIFCRFVYKNHNYSHINLFFTKFKIYFSYSPLPVLCLPFGFLLILPINLVSLRCYINLDYCFYIYLEYFYVFSYCLSLLLLSLSFHLFNGASSSLK